MRARFFFALPLALAIEGCAGARLSEPVSATSARPAILAVEQGGAERAALLEQLAKRDAELKEWKATAASLRNELDALKKAHDSTKRELADARRQAESFSAERDRALSRIAALEKERRELAARLSASELAAIQRERELLEAELARLGAEIEGRPASSGGAENGKKP
jgi:chromosome segregation ATPase